MTPDHPIFCLARFTLEAKTPLSIASGTRNGGFDMALATDASGLPSLPGTSLAGVLRNEYRKRFGDDESRDLFGWQDSDVGAPAILHVASGVLQDSLGHAFEGLPLSPERRTHLQNDNVLAHAFDQLNRPIFRDAVRISHRGTAAETGKFERVILPAGNRFSCELTLWAASADDPRWARVCDLLAGAELRMGGGTRNGLGAMRAVELHTAVLKLDDPKDYATFSKMGRDIDDMRHLHKQEITLTEDASPYLAATIKLTPNAFWRVGQGKSALGSYEDGNVPRLLPLTEPRVTWQDGKGSVGDAEVLLPGSSIKGALSHRQCFHLNRLQGKWSTLPATSLPEYDKSEDKVLRALYGYARGEGDGQEQPSGQAGRVFVRDVFVSQISGAVGVMPHNVIDRFTGGVRDRLLFSEELIWKTPVDIQVMVDTAAIEQSISGDGLMLIKQSLALALDDLVNGRLALGSACARGHGFFNGSVEWSDGGKWIAGEAGSLKETAA
ncbi:MAG: RAMP superfamily CRISPR-associated protein [Gammaproteobacteria bacterium]